MMPAKAKQSSSEDPVQKLLADVTAKYGAGSLMEMGSAPIAPVEVIPSGSIALDAALGVGGLPRGRVVEIYGPEMAGKTTIALHVIANVQRNGGHAVMIDAEHALDLEYARNLGVDTDHLLLDQPDTGEQALEIADMVIRSGVIDVVVIDSVSALVPRAEIEGMMGDSHIGLQARLMSQALRKITPALTSTRTTVIFINQLREKVGIVFGNPEVTSGGKALKFYASVRLDIRKIETLKNGEVTVGHKVRVKVVKNKLAPPFRQCECDIIYGRGISREAEIVDLGVAHGLIKKSGAWYAFPDSLGTAQGKEGARAWLLEHSAATDELERRVRERMAKSPSSAISASLVVPSASTESLMSDVPLSDLASPNSGKAAQ
jgi:recombination protein RecA